MGVQKKMLFLILYGTLVNVACSGGGAGGAGATTNDSSNSTTTFSIEESPSLSELQECLANPSSDPRCASVKNETLSHAVSASTTDILFVLDESCSMATIANNLHTGFSSLQNQIYPENTKMAVTYMSPVKLLTDSLFDFAQPFNSNVNPLAPGFMKLVTSASIASYVAAVPAESSYFPEAGCSEDWFSPDQKDIQGNSCLSAAVQLAPTCTGTEAGLVAFEQLLAKYNQDGKRLFRSRALVNIVFVSDTHEPGSNYFGKPGAPARIKNYEEVLAMILANSPDVLSIKFSGVLPLPIVGDPIYSHLKVAGPIPQNATEAAVGGEQFWNYAYLPLISSFDGVVSHAKSGDWSGIAQSLIDDSKYTGSLQVTLENPAKRIFYILINGVEVPSDKYSVSTSGKFLSIKHSTLATADLDIQVIFQ